MKTLRTAKIIRLKLYLKSTEIPTNTGIAFRRLNIFALRGTAMLCTAPIFTIFRQAMLKMPIYQIFSAMPRAKNSAAKQLTANVFYAVIARGLTTIFSMSDDFRPAFMCAEKYCALFIFCCIFLSFFFQNQAKILLRYQFFLRSDFPPNRGKRECRVRPHRPA